MKIENYHCIKSLKLPAGWAECKAGSGFATRIVRSFTPPGSSDVKMEFFYRGLPVSDAAGKAFRKVLKQAPKTVFDHNNSNKPTKAEVQLICDLEEVLGNIGNNQISNTETGPSGPPFLLERLDALLWNDKPLLAGRGWFINPETGERRYAFCGFFIDANPNQAACSVEEIYLEADKEDLYAQCMPQFEECLRSIEWLAK